MTQHSARQRVHYEKILDDYEAHYYDDTSMAFRNRFVYDVMFRGLELNGKDVVDLAAGTGHNSLAVLERFPMARVVGFDISPSACEGYRKRVGADAVEMDLTKDYEGNEEFDVAMIVGGLHHCVSNLPTALHNVARMLRPRGILLMYEPNAQFVLDAVRRLWYRYDGYFDAQTEHALDHDKCAAMAEGAGLVPFDCVYSGGPAYFLIYNSLIFRVPLALKRKMAPLLFAVEGTYNKVPWKTCFPTFIARWKKRQPEEG